MSLRADGPPTATKGDIARRREYDSLVLAVVVEAAGASTAPISEIVKTVSKRWEGDPAQGRVLGALKRLRRAGRVVAVSRGSWREWRPTGVR